MKTRYVLPVSPFACRALLTLSLSGLAFTALGQVTPTTPVYPLPAPTNPDSVALGTTDPQQFATPSVVGMGPSKGLIFHYERVPRFNVTSAGQTVGLRDYNTDATKNARLVIKGYIPMLNHPHLKLILGVNYEREEFQFSNRPTGYELYDNIENKGLKTLGTQLAVIRPVNAVNWYIFRVKGELSGDYTSSELNVTDYLRVSSEFLYGWKRSPTFSWGVGVQLGYTFGRFSPYPALLYNRTFNKHWGIEALFPARVTARYNASPRSLFFAGYSVDGLNYIVKLRTPLQREGATLNSLELRETEVKFRARWEREIYDFLWFGVEGGYRYNYAFDAFDRTNDNRIKIIDSKLANAPYASLELFIVPPRKLLKRQ
ncbi:DUF6268 family outer membrane beta-barrel protein [Hymenobacter metallicola]|uniref:DUF6268 domain-containing protein n=1 Tax=Hymenobacter metallicola TaxID=2563114 RepID=A0A4Z0QE97_9BACT|nr:DUF6268 family outer membrane beta-barrel protein [Hymenobacter metallicola]TGE27351.1 hypothetical protein E5K02_13275 [Hymenobacter metallicola]